MKQFEPFLFIAASQGLLAIALGAFGSHGLKKILSEPMLAVWQTGVQYHFYHALALLAVALFWQKGITGTWLQTAFWCFSTGIVLFCGSLYWLSLGGPRWLGPITPLGGLSFMLGWASLMVAAWR